MANISVVAEDVELNEPTMVEGFPGAGLAGKIAADHLVDTLELVHYADVFCEGIPKLATYSEGTTDLASPVRLHASEDGELVVLQSDVPIEPEPAREFMRCFSPWLEANATPVFVAGIPTKEREDPPSLFGVAAGEGRQALGRTDLTAPTGRGVISGPAGSMLSYALEHEVTAVGLVVEVDPRFPDPTAAIRVLEDGIEPITGRDVSVDVLESHASQIQAAKERLAETMRSAEEASSEARPLRMFQ